MPQQTEGSGIAGLKLFTGAPQDENFSHMQHLMKVKEMTPSPRPFEFATGPAINLPRTYTSGGAEKDLRAFLDETHTSALLVLKDGAVRFEEYWRTGGRRVQWMSMSVAKSFTSALVGIAMEEGRFASLEDPIDKYVPKLSGTAYDGVRIKDVLQMSSGARWYEDYNDPTSDALRLGGALAPGGSLDEFMAGMVRDVAPGTQ